MLDKHFLDSPYSLTYIRVLHEIRTRSNCTARGILEELPLDEGYLSRIIDRFVKDGIVDKFRIPEDRRAFRLSLTDKGQEFVLLLDRNANSSISQLVKELSAVQLEALTQAMGTIENLLDDEKGRH